MTKSALERPCDLRTRPRDRHSKRGRRASAVLFQQRICRRIVRGPNGVTSGETSPRCPYPAASCYLYGQNAGTESRLQCSLRHRRVDRRLECFFRPWAFAKFIGVLVNEPVGIDLTREVGLPPQNGSPVEFVAKRRLLQALHGNHTVSDQRLNHFCRAVTGAVVDEVNLDSLGDEIVDNVADNVCFVYRPSSATTGIEMTLVSESNRATASDSGGRCGRRRTSNDGIRSESSRRRRQRLGVADVALSHRSATALLSYRRSNVAITVGTSATRSDRSRPQ